MCKQRDELNELIVLLESVSIEFLHAKIFSNQKATLNKGVNLGGANEELRMKTIKRLPEARGDTRVTRLRLVSVFHLIG